MRAQNGWRDLAARLGMPFLFLASPVVSRADFAIDWFTLDGGGGTSTSAVFTVTGTIGQPDAGVSSGGNFTLIGGFWGVVVVQPGEGAPLLRITRSGGNVILSWRNPSSGFQLQECSSLSPTITWSDVAEVPVVVGNDKQVALVALSGNRFFRLRKP